MTKKEFVDAVLKSVAPMEQKQLLREIDEKIVRRHCNRKIPGLCNQCHFRKDCELILLIESRREIMQLSSKIQAFESIFTKEE